MTLSTTEQIANLEHELTDLRKRRDHLTRTLQLIRYVVWAAGLALIAALIAAIATGHGEAFRLLLVMTIFFACFALALRLFVRRGEWVLLFDRRGYLAFLHGAIAVREERLAALQREIRSPG